MNLYVVSSEKTPNVFVKAKNEKDALDRFKHGLAPHLLNQPFNVRLVDINSLMELTPDEFRVTEDTSF